LLDLQSKGLAYQMLMQRRPAKKFTGTDGQRMDFEQHLRKFEAAMEQIGGTPQMKLMELGHWFGGVASILVDRYFLRKDAEVALMEAIEALKKEFGKKKESAEEMLEELLSGEKIDQRDIQGFLSFVLRLENAYLLAIETHRNDEFERKTTHSNILFRKFPYFADQWATQRAKQGLKEDRVLGFKDFLQWLKTKQKIAENISRQRAVEGLKGSQVPKRMSPYKMGEPRAPNPMPKGPNKGVPTPHQTKFPPWGPVREPFPSNPNTGPKNPTPHTSSARLPNNPIPHANNGTNCTMCLQPHPLEFCSRFKALDVPA
jgi:hypothetical protein